VHVVRYESLLADFENERGTMYRFLGLDPAEADGPARDPKSVPGYTQDNVMSFFRSGRAGDWRKYGIERFCDWFKAEAGEALVMTGYEKDKSWAPPATPRSETTGNGQLPPAQQVFVGSAHVGNSMA